MLVSWVQVGSPLIDINDLADAMCEINDLYDYEYGQTNYNPNNKASTAGGSVFCHGVTLCTNF